MQEVTNIQPINSYSLFYKKTEGSNTFLGVHADDILLTEMMRMRFKLSSYNWMLPSKLKI